MKLIAFWEWNTRVPLYTTTYGFIVSLKTNICKWTGRTHPRWHLSFGKIEWPVSKRTFSTYSMNPHALKNFSLLVDWQNIGTGGFKHPLLMVSSLCTGGSQIWMGQVSHFLRVWVTRTTWDTCMSNAPLNRMYLADLKYAIKNHWSVLNFIFRVLRNLNMSGTIPDFIWQMDNLLTL